MFLHLKMIYLFQNYQVYFEKKATQNVEKSILGRQVNLRNDWHYLWEWKLPKVIDFYQYTKQA